MDGVYEVCSMHEVYEAYEVDDVDENGTSILKLPMVSSFCQGQSSFTQALAKPTVAKDQARRDV